MDWETYKKLCDQPNVFSRWMLEQTLELVQTKSVGTLLAAVLNEAPLKKPVDHHGDERTDMFQLQLRESDVDKLYRLVVKAVQARMVTKATHKRGLGGFTAAWQEYLAHVRQF